MLPAQIIISFFFNTVCGAATPIASSATSANLCDTTQSLDNPTLALGLCVAALTDGRSAAGRCEVWATNLLITFFIGAVVFARAWWACGNLPPSDGSDEPALGRVLQRTSTQTEAEAAAEGEGSVTSLSRLSVVATRTAAERARSLNSRADAPARLQSRDRSPTPSSASSLYPCVSSYLPAESASTLNAREAASSASPVRCGSGSRDREVREHRSVFDQHAKQLRHRALYERLSHAVSAWTPVRCVVSAPQRVGLHLYALHQSCTAAWAIVWMPFSVLPSFSALLSSCGQQSDAQRRQHQHPQQHHHCYRWCHHTSTGDVWTQVLLDRSDEDQDGLWAILEGIERRRRALTGRNLLREPLPLRRGGRWGGGSYATDVHARAPDEAGRMTSSTTTTAAAAAEDGEMRSVTSSPFVAVPVLATGVPLAFCTDRRVRPVVVDRHGHWVPVAVMDEAGEYYNYNLDLVLPQD